MTLISRYLAIPLTPQSLIVHRGFNKNYELPRGILRLIDLTSSYTVAIISNLSMRYNTNDSGDILVRGTDLGDENMHGEYPRH